jgi:hypothetical protein
MENADRHGVIRMPVDNGLQEVRNMLTRRDPTSKDLEEKQFDVEGVQLIWSFVRGETAAAGVEALNKGSAATLIAAAEAADKKLIIVYTRKRTNDGRRAFEEYKGKHRIENWKLDRIYLNPFKFNYYRDAGHISKDDITPELMERISKDPTENVETYDTDPLPRYLGAEIGDLVWTDNTWGTLEPSIDYRIVISSRTVSKLFAS